VAKQLPTLPTAAQHANAAATHLALGVHAHVPGPPLHDDHACDHVTCALCGKPGLAIHGVWLEIVD
jgi:hypothetical protein